MDGTYLPGHRMGIEELANQLGVSTQPIREALVTLANEGVLEVLPRRGFRVVALRRRDVEDVFRVHAYIAGLLAEEAAAVIDPEQIARLHEMQDQIERVAGRARSHRDLTTIESLNFSFHRTINLVPEAHRLRWFLRAATRYVPRHFFTSWLDTTVGEHPAIIEALERHDASLARRLIEIHVASAAPLVVANLIQSGVLIGAESHERAPEGSA